MHIALFRPTEFITEEENIVLAPSSDSTCSAISGRSYVEDLQRDVLSDTAILFANAPLPIKQRYLIVGLRDMKQSQVNWPAPTTPKLNDAAKQPHADMSCKEIPSYKGTKQK